jgi:hypothetical protein
VRAGIALAAGAARTVTSPWTCTIFAVLDQLLVSGRVETCNSSSRRCFRAAYRGVTGVFTGARRRSPAARWTPGVGHATGLSSRSREWSANLNSFSLSPENQGRPHERTEFGCISGEVSCNRGSKAGGADAMRTERVTKTAG